VDDPGVVVAFWILSAITVGSALLVAASRNLIHAVIFLVTSFLGVAGLYVTLAADFVAVSQVLIYAGAVSVLILFAIMLTPRARRDNSETFLRLPALMLAALVGVIVAFVAVDTDWSIEDRPAFEETASVIGSRLLNEYVLAFEIAAVLLVAAILGAVVLVRPEPPTEDEP
jgi:NADH-quinone oxidoreductase subunit J